MSPAPAEAAAIRPEEPIRLLQRRTVRSLAIAQIIGTMGVAVTPVIGVLLAQQVTDSEIWAGLARTGSTLGAALGGLPLATLAVRRGRRWALTTGWSVSALGAMTLILAAQWQSLTALLIGLLIAGVGTATQLQARFAATDLAAPIQKARALSTVVWIGTLGSVIGPNLGGPGEWLARRLHLADLGGAFVFAAAALLLAGGTTAVLLRPDPLLTAAARNEPAPQAPGPARRLAVVSEVRDLARSNPAARLAIAAIITAQVLMVAVMTMAPMHMSDVGGSLTVVGISISLHIVGMYGLAPIAGAVSDRFGAATGIALGAVLFAASFAVAIIDAGSMSAVTGSLILLGLGWSFMGVAGAASLSAAVADDRRARVQGFADTASNLAAAVAAFLGGPVMWGFGYDGLATAAAIAMLPVCILLIGRGSARNIPEPATR
ncbi:MAG TPA: MFS transporter [Mycobacteriales bacterium]|nr:MFS transporter [Mycobacteriales bacterium]